VDATYDVRTQVIINLADDHVEHVHALNFPGRSEEGYSMAFSKVCYIEETDFREVDSKDYYGLAPGKAIMLRCSPCPEWLTKETNREARMTKTACALCPWRGWNEVKPGCWDRATTQSQFIVQTRATKGLEHTTRQRPRVITHPHEGIQHSGRQERQERAHRGGE
jgi:hypothetical protein